MVGGKAGETVSYAERAVIQVSKPLHDRLAELKREQQDRLKRQVSFSEVIEQLLEKAEAA